MIPRRLTNVSRTLDWMASSEPESAHHPTYSHHLEMSTSEPLDTHLWACTGVFAVWVCGTLQHSEGTVPGQSPPQVQARRRTLTNRRRSVDLIPVQEGLQVDCPEICTTLLKAIGRILRTARSST
jgi:hypothetical protein